MKIVQILPTISYGDAVSNSAVNIMMALRERSFTTEIYAINIHPKMQKLAKSMDKFKPEKWDVMIYHMAIGCDLPNLFSNWNTIKHKWMIYHNITPSHFFSGFDKNSEELSELGRQQLHNLKDVITLAIADSNYNKLELDELGYKNTVTLPIILSFEDYNIEPNKVIFNRYKDDYVNILFVGRIAPNKKHEEIIKIFYYYKKYVNPQSRLFLVGSYHGMERYYANLERLVEELDLQDVIFTGHVPFRDIITYYRVSDIFLCMSEHEGFCVPLLEAMYFDLPILAYNSTAIPETLGESGILINQKNYIEIAEMIDYIMKNDKIRHQIINKQKERLAYFSKDKVIEGFLKIVGEGLGLTK